jgi:glycosyltransferase involved in cell wall biosynthesis
MEGSARSPPRVLMVVENFSVPSDRRVWPECLALRDAGFEVEVICPQGADGEDAEPFEEREGVPIFRYSVRPSDGSLLGYGREYLGAVWQILALARRRTRRRPFDVVHAANPPDLLLPALWPLKRQGARFVFDHHDLSPELYATRFGARRQVLNALRLAERLSFALADVVLATNESYRRIAIERGRMHPHDVFVVRNGPDARRFAPRPAEPALKRGHRYLLSYVGLIEPQDGVDLAIQALALLRRRRSDWHAVFVGSGGGLSDAEALTGELGLDEVVEFTGFVADRERVLQILASSDVCLSPEPKNAFNDASTLIKVAEYMAMERPVVAFELTETRVTAGKAAMYAAPNDPASFANCIEAVLDDPVRRARMGAVGRARVTRGLSWGHSRQALLDAYAQLLDRRAKASAAAASGGAPSGFGGGKAARGPVSGAGRVSAA